MICFRVHCFNNYAKNEICPDLEVSYYIECSTKIDLGIKINRQKEKSQEESKQNPIVCQNTRACLECDETGSKP